MNVQRVTENWKSGLWGIAQLKLAYAKGVITKSQYKAIKLIPQDGQVEPNG